MARRQHTIVCQHCKRTFITEVATRRFCSVKCRANDPTFKAMVAASNGARKGIANQNCGPDRNGTTQPCENGCGTPVYRKPGDSNRRRYCARTCYYDHLARLFDRDIGVVSTLPELHNYDEILSAETLQCVVTDCTWTGHNLSLHMHLAHGITEAEFKAAAGFNKGTGVISATMRKKMEHDRKPAITDATRAAISNHQARTQPMRREAREHFAKAMALRNALTPAPPPPPPVTA